MTIKTQAEWKIAYGDLELVNTGNGVVNRLLQGVSRVTPEVTR